MKSLHRRGLNVVLRSLGLPWYQAPMQSSFRRYWFYFYFGRPNLLAEGLNST
ncbi:MAG TPA: hypothetical protein VK025_01255 [Steroidobacter sp.]|jgi:hypothetical protein|nr:hypothetical protein [Steroidobacter sp.]